MKVSRLLEILQDCHPDSEILIDIRVENERRLSLVQSVENRHVSSPDDSLQGKLVHLQDFRPDNQSDFYTTELLDSE